MEAKNVSWHPHNIYIIIVLVYFKCLTLPNDKENSDLYFLITAESTTIVRILVHIWAIYSSFSLQTMRGLHMGFFKRFYLFLKRGKGRGKERERNIYQFPLIHIPSGDWNHNPGIKTVTRIKTVNFHLEGQCLINWATLDGAASEFNNPFR